MTWNTAMSDSGEPEGWCLDPYGRHELRWYSAGRPTALVRDGRLEGHDEPPGGPPPHPPVPAPEVDAPVASDYDAEEAAERAFRAAAWGDIGE
jgi:hypothetical protein